MSSTATTTANVSSHPKTDDNTAVIIIFDWDDTILPSSFVDKSNFDNISELPPAMRATFREIEVCTEKCLAAAACHGEVSREMGIYIITMILCATIHYYLFADCPISLFPLQ